MNGTFDILTLLFLVIAVVIFLRLRSVLGRRTGQERPHYDPYSAQDAKGGGARDNIVTLPRDNGRVRPDDSERTSALEKRFKDYAPTGSALSRGLLDVARADRSFDPKQFLDGARAAYEMIVTAFAEGDTRQLKQLLSRDVYDGFAAAIGKRERNGESVDFKFVGILKSDLIDAELVNRMAHVTIKFVSELITATRDMKGEVIDGDPSKIREVTDIWTFARDTGSRDPNWKLIATETAN